jgi:hypothetical protein
MNILDPIFYRTLFYDFRQWSPRDHKKYHYYGDMKYHTTLNIKFGVASKLHWNRVLRFAQRQRCGNVTKQVDAHHETL